MFPVVSKAQHEPAQEWRIVRDVEPQPFLAGALRIQQALSYLGASLPLRAGKELERLTTREPDSATASRIQAILDPFCLAAIDINPEARVKVGRGPAKALLRQGGWSTFLVKVYNAAGTTAALQVESPAARPLLHMSNNTTYVPALHELSVSSASDRFLELALYKNRPMLSNLSGLSLEYAILQVYSRDKGKREASIGFHIGQGTQDIAYRNWLPVLFNILPAVKVTFRVRDEHNNPCMASFLIRDAIERVLPDSGAASNDVDYRLRMAGDEFNVQSPRLSGLYPLPSRRLAAADEYPDFFFQPQVYRSDGEHVLLPPGRFEVTFTRGPEYICHTKLIEVNGDRDSMEVRFSLDRWVNMSELGWYSADHHIHASGCSHYDSPEEGVDPQAIFRQIQGEDLQAGAVLTWGPGWYHQKKNFTGGTNKLSSASHLMRYDVEVSGFPSSHAGHLVLLGLQEDDYPGTQNIEDWPSWTGPVLDWAHKQRAIAGYAHSGWGLEPVTATSQLPNTVVPLMNGIGANEYVVTVTQGLIDFFSAGDTPAPWELNMWYHSLNCGLRPRLSGETDFPCIFDERVGMARSYCQIDGEFTYEKYINAIGQGRSYVSDGRSHIIDFSVNNVRMGDRGSELRMDKPGSVIIKARVNALLDSVQSEANRQIAARPLTQAPYWNLERARINGTRSVAVELLFNGVPVDTVLIIADGKWKDIAFTYATSKSGWFALRVFPSVHTNPIFVVIDKQPVLVHESAVWCRNAVDQCWNKKSGAIRENERAAAAAMYRQARRFYDALITAKDKNNKP